MRRLPIVCTALGVLLLSLATHARTLEPSILERVRPAVVFVEVEEGAQVTSSGSGFLWWRGSGVGIVDKPSRSRTRWTSC